jgi:hypothetical protein
MISGVPEFWPTVVRGFCSFPVFYFHTLNFNLSEKLLGHAEIQENVLEEDERVLMFCNDVVVQEADDLKSGYSITLVGPVGGFFLYV